MKSERRKWEELVGGGRPNINIRLVQSNCGFAITEICCSAQHWNTFLINEVMINTYTYIIILIHTYCFMFFDNDLILVVYLVLFYTIERMLGKTN